MSGIVSEIGSKSGLVDIGAAMGFDYEEGTWTPTLVSGGAMGTVQVAAYVRVGNICTVILYVQIVGGSGAHQEFGGLPFKTLNHHVGSVNGGGIPIGSFCRTVDNSNNLKIMYQSGSGQGNVSGNQCNGGHIICNVTYITAGSAINIIGHNA